MLHDRRHEIEEPVALEIHRLLKTGERRVVIEVISGCRKDIGRPGDANDGLEDARRVRGHAIMTGDNEKRG